MPTEKSTFKLVVTFLGFALLACLGGILALALLEREVPTVFENVAIAALAAMAGLLARTPTSDKPQPVNVVNAPLPVEDTSDVGVAGHGHELDMSGEDPDRGSVNTRTLALLGFALACVAVLLVLSR